MKRARLLITMAGAVMVALSLGGCSTLQGMFPPSQQEIAHQKAEKQKALQQQCNNADYLLSDLTKPASKRVYSIKPGVTCND